MFFKKLLESYKNMWPHIWITKWEEEGNQHLNIEPRAINLKGNSNNTTKPNGRWVKPNEWGTTFKEPGKLDERNHPLNNFVERGYINKVPSPNLEE